MMALFLATAIPNSIPASIHSVLPGGFLVLADAALRALLVTAVVGAGLRLLASRHVPAQKAAWGMVLAGALLMPLIAPIAGNANWVPSGATLVVPAHAWSQVIVSQVSALLPAKREVETPRAVPAPSTAAAIDISPAPVERVGALASSDGPSFPAPAISNAPTSGTGAPSPRPWNRMLYLPLSDVVWMIYGAVCLALLLRLAYGLGGAIGLWQSAEPVYLDSQLADGLHLRSSRKISSPVTIGSAVVLPDDYNEWDIEKLRIVLAHERSHVRQGDFYLQALAGLYAAIFWFSPLGWWLKRKLSDLSEAISDHAGLEEAADHASYARILLEFAALPRRAEVGVAMAHTGRISQRIERLLNESSFRQAFAGGRSRLWAAVVLVPAVLFAAAALLRVEAAVTLQQPVIAQGPVVQTHAMPDASATPALPAAAQEPGTPEPPPATGAKPAVAPVPAPAAPRSIPGPSNPAVAAPPAPPSDEDQDLDESDTVTTTNAKCNARHAAMASSHSFTRMSNGNGFRYAYSGNGYRYAYSSNGDSYALVSGSGKNHTTSFSGDWFDGRRAEFDKARTMAKGDFLWFTHGGKSYVVDDPATIASIQAMYKPMEDLGRQQEELGRKQEALGRQQEELGKRQEQASVPTPDVSKEMARLNAAVAKLQEKKDGTVTIEQLADLQAEIGELQGKLGDLQGQVGARQGEFGHQQGLLGEQQGRLGAEQGRLGAEQGRIARDADAKVKSIIDQSLKNGKARPVQ